MVEINVRIVVVIVIAYATRVFFEFQNNANVRSEEPAFALNSPLNQLEVPVYLRVPNR